MSESSRQEMLSKIRGALKSGPRARSASHDYGASEAYQPAPASSTALRQRAQQISALCDERRESLIKRFQTELELIGGHFYLAESARSACDYVCRVAAAENAKQAVAGRWPVIDRIGLAEAFRALGIHLAVDGSQGVAEGGSGEFIPKAIESVVGITGVDYALADTATLVLLAKKHQPRSASLLPPVHIALVEAGQILSGLDDLFALIRADHKFSDEPPSAVTFITGPSRTADIELTLVVGVHGPQRLHVVVVGG